MSRCSLYVLALLKRSGRCNFIKRTLWRARHVAWQCLPWRASLALLPHISAVRCGGSSSRIRIRKNDKDDMSSRMRKERHKTRCIDTSLEIVRLRKVDFVVAVGIRVGFGPELGSEKNSPKINKKLIFMHSISQIYP